MDQLEFKVREIEDWVIEIRRDLHQHPELGFEEYRTRDKILEYLREIGIKSHVVAKTGVVATIKGNGQGKTVALRADMDALPMEDKKEVPYRSKFKGKAHACGHDAHVAILLGIAKVLNGMKDRITGTVKLFFQPSEETLGGALPMIEEGVLEDPYVDGIFGLHVDTGLPVGNIGLKYGKMKAASDMIRIIIHGKNSHGAYPQEGTDAIVIGGQVLVGLQTVVSRDIDPRSSAVVTIGTIRGGSGHNIIADQVEMEGMVRTLEEEQRTLVLSRVESIVEQIAQSLGGRGEVIIKKGYASLINDDNMVNIVRRTATELLGKNSIYEIPTPSFGVEDFSYFAALRPSAYFHLGAGNKEKGIIHGGHTSYFDIDEKCLTKGILMQINNVLNFLNG